MNSTGMYVPRHGVTAVSTMARAVVDQKRANQAVMVLAATSDLPASRELYQLLLLAGALHPALAVAS